MAVGFSAADRESDSQQAFLNKWVAVGRHAGMQWMARHAVLRSDPESILPGARTIISVAYSYEPRALRDASLPVISRYAYGADYHDVLREVLGKIVRDAGIEQQCRICIDSAPISERYRAARAGIGVVGDNGMLIVPGVGAEVFLAEIVTTIEYEPDAATAGECLHCGACRRICPTGALQEDGTIDCRRCISYLTIEHRGPWMEDEAVEAMSTEAGRHTLFGCDACVTVCPMNNAGAAERNVLFPADPDIINMKKLPDFPSKGAFRRQFAGSPLLRPGIEGLLRNQQNCNKPN